LYSTRLSAAELYVALINTTEEDSEGEFLIIIRGIFASSYASKLNGELTSLCMLVELDRYIGSTHNRGRLWEIGTIGHQ